MEQVRQEKLVIRRCECKCCTFVVEKTIWTDGDIAYDITIQDARYDHDYNTLWGRIKRAFKALFGKPVYYNDVYLEGEDAYASLLEELKDLQNFGHEPTGEPSAAGLQAK